MSSGCSGVCCESLPSCAPLCRATLLLTIVVPAPVAVRDAVYVVEVSSSVAHGRSGRSGCQHADNHVSVATRTRRAVRPADRLNAGSQRWTWRRTSCFARRSAIRRRCRCAADTTQANISRKAPRRRDAGGCKQTVREATPFPAVPARAPLKARDSSPASTQTHRRRVHADHRPTCQHGQFLPRTLGCGLGGLTLRLVPAIGDRRLKHICVVLTDNSCRCIAALTIPC